MERADIAKRIRQLRTERGFTQNALANISGISPTYLYQLERGEKSPTVEYLDHICWGLGITLADFFATEDDARATVPDRISSLTAAQRRLLNVFLGSVL